MNKIQNASVGSINLELVSGRVTKDEVLQKQLEQDKKLDEVVRWCGQLPYEGTEDPIYNKVVEGIKGTTETDEGDNDVESLMFGKVNTFGKFGSGITQYFNFLRALITTYSLICVLMIPVFVMFYFSPDGHNA